MSNGLAAIVLAKPQSTFFESHLIFIVPALVIVAAAIAQISGAVIAPLDEQFATFVAEFIFLNNSHAVFSLVAIFCIPEVTAVVSHKKRYFSNMTLGLSLLLILMTVSFKLDVRVKVFYEILLIYVSLWHSVKQTYGLVRSHSIRHLNEIKSSREVLFEKTLLYSLLLVSVSFNPRILERYAGYFHVVLDIPRLYETGMILMALILITLIVMNLRHAKTVSGAFLKMLYLMPYLVFPFSCLSLLGFFVLKTVHGTQAYFAYKNIYQETKAAPEQKSRFLTLSLALMTFQVLAYTFSFEESRFWPNILFSALTITISYIHIYHERFLFKHENQV